MTTTYFLGPRLLGTSPSLPLWDDTTVSPMSQVVICPVCGEVWGRIAVEGREWLPVRRGCTKHSWLGDVGGSFLPPWRHSFDELPPAVLAYEVNLRLAAFQEPST